MHPILDRYFPNEFYRARIVKLWSQIRNRKSRQAFDELLDLAQKGSVLSMIGIGAAYQRGDAIPRDLKAAEAWLLRAKEADCAWAGFCLGDVYFRSKRYQDAEREFSIAVSKDIPEARYPLGKMYLFGMGVPKDVERARSLFEEAKASGSRPAEGALATMQLFMGPHRRLGLKRLLSYQADLARRIVRRWWPLRRHASR